MPTPCPPFVLTLRPIKEGIRSYILGPSAHVQLNEIDLNTTSLKLEDGHLVMHLPQGGTLLLLEFKASAQSPCGITFHTREGDTLHGTDILHMLGVPVTHTRAVVGVVEPLPVAINLL